MTLDCVYPLARDHLSFPELMPDYEPHKALEIHLMSAGRLQLFDTRASLRDRTSRLLVRLADGR